MDLLASAAWSMSKCRDFQIHAVHRVMILPLAGLWRCRPTVLVRVLARGVERVSCELSRTKI